jgi:DNA-binding MarR family transcriptional regulator
LELSPAESLILQAFKAGGSTFTLRQLKARTALSTGALDAGIRGLKDKGLVAELNTLIPSYSYRYPGVEV